MQDSESRGPFGNDSGAGWGRQQPAALGYLMSNGWKWSNRPSGACRQSGKDAPRHLAPSAQSRDVFPSFTDFFDAMMAPTQPSCPYNRSQYPRPLPSWRSHRHHHKHERTLLCNRLQVRKHGGFWRVGNILLSSITGAGTLLIVISKSER